MNDFYKKVEKLLEEKGVTVYKLCEETGIRTVSMTQWKNGLSNPNVKNLKKLADYFGVQIEYFLD